jgi:integrase
VSVHRGRRPDGATVYRVRYREGGRGTPQRSRTFDSRDDALDFDRRVRRLKQTGDPAFAADQVSLSAYVYDSWWPDDAERRLALSTQEGHSIDLELRIIPRLGHLPLSHIRPSVVERFIADLERAGTGRATILSTLAVLQGVMKRAVRDFNLPANPVREIDKPSQRRERDPVLITVGQVEAMRVWCVSKDDLRSATLIGLLAYAGPRPESEALPLRWGHVRDRTILFRATKRGVPEERATRLLAPLAADLDAWRRASGNPPDDALVFPSRRGALWAGHDWDNWRERRFLAAAQIAGLAADKALGPRRVRPRDLRSSFATLLIYEGQPPQYVAEQLGHSPATLLRDYARVWQEFDPAKRVSAEQQIERVRSRLRRNGVLSERDAHAVRHVCSTARPVFRWYSTMTGRSVRVAPETPANPGKPSGGLEPPTPSLPWKCSTD